VCPCLASRRARGETECPLTFLDSTAAPTAATLIEELAET